MNVSVIVATRDRPADLSRCLSAIAALSYPTFELIIADQSADDLTAIVDRFPQLHVTHLRLQTTGKARAINAAVAIATGDILALTDDDCEVPSDWLQRGVSMMQSHPEAGIVFGALPAADHDPSVTYVPVFLPGAFRIERGRVTRAHRLGVGADMFIRREALDRIGRFDERHGPGGVFRSGDDWELAYRALKHRYAVIQDPGIVVVHHGRRDYAGGTPRRMISNNYHGIGAGYAYHFRSGDARAGYILLQETAIVLADIAWNMVRLRRPFGFRRLSYMLVGAVIGLRSKLTPGIEQVQAPTEFAAPSSSGVAGEVPSE